MEEYQNFELQPYNESVKKEITGKLMELPTVRPTLGNVDRLLIQVVDFDSKQVFEIVNTGCYIRNCGGHPTIIRIQ